MLTLSIETSGRSGGAALSRGEEPVASIAVSSSETHSRRLLPTIRWLVQRAGVTMEELQCIAVSLGPGSFTGIRIGLATARGLSVALSVPLSGVPTLDVLAAGIPPVPGMLLCPVVDARNGRFYTSCYIADDMALRWRRLLQYHVSTPSDLHGLVLNKGFVPGQERYDGALAVSRIMFTGDAVSTCGNEIRDAFSGLDILFAPEHLCQPDPRSVAAMAAEYLHTDHLNGPHPIYVRLSQAEEKKMADAGASSYLPAHA